MDAIRKLQLELTLDDIKWALVNAPKLGIKANQVVVVAHKNRLRIFIEEEDKFGRLKSLKRALPSVVVKVSRHIMFAEVLQSLTNAVDIAGSPTDRPRHHQAGRKDPRPGTPL